MVATLLLSIPPWFGVTLLNGSQWLSVVTLVFGTYVAGNVVQKRLVAPNNSNPEEGEA